MTASINAVAWTISFFVRPYLAPHAEMQAGAVGLLLGPLEVTYAFRLNVDSVADSENRVLVGFNY